MNIFEKSLPGYAIWLKILWSMQSESRNHTGLCELIVQRDGCFCKWMTCELLIPYTLVVYKYLKLLIWIIDIFCFSEVRIHLLVTWGNKWEWTLYVFLIILYICKLQAKRVALIKTKLSLHCCGCSHTVVVSLNITVSSCPCLSLSTFVGVERTTSFYFCKLKQQDFYGATPALSFHSHDNLGLSVCSKEVPPLGCVAPTGYMCSLLAAVKIPAEACTAGHGLTAGRAANAGWAELTCLKCIWLFMWASSLKWEVGRLCQWQNPPSCWTIFCQ